MCILRNHVALIRPHKQEALLKITPYEVIEKPIVSSLSASITIVNKLSVSAKNSSDKVSKFVYRKSFETRYAFTLISWHGIGCMCVDLRWNREKDRSKDQKWFIFDSDSSLRSSAYLFLRLKLKSDFLSYEIIHFFMREIRDLALLSAII